LHQVVIGSGPAAQKCAIDAVKRGKVVALVDKNSQMGGVCVVRAARGLVIHPSASALPGVPVLKRAPVLVRRACLQHTGTIPSKTFREAVLHLTGYRHHGFYGRSHFMSNRRATLNDILQRVQKVEDQEAEVRV
jgi:NAD(P) transhydrogenase